MKKTCLVATLFLLGIVSGTQAFAGTTALFSDNFDSYVTGNPPGNGWGSFTAGGTIAVDDTVFLGGSGKSVRIQRSSTDNNDGCSFGHLHNALYSGRVIYEAYLRTNDAGVETVVMIGADSTNTRFGPWVSMGGNAGYLVYYAGGPLINIMPISAGVWYHVKLVCDMRSKTYDIYVDDMNTPQVTGVQFLSGDLTFLDSLRFVVFYATNPPVIGDDLAYVDNVSATAVVSASVPTMTEWGLVVMGILLGGGALLAIKKRIAA